MSKVVAALATSHTPMLVVPGEQWGELGARDPENPDLYSADGRFVSYDDLLSERSAPAAIRREQWEQQWLQCQESLDELGRRLRASRPDAVVIVGDDQKELFSDALQPTIAVFYGERFEMERLAGHGHPFAQLLRDGYAMSGGRSFAGHPELAQAIIEGLMGLDIDVATSRITPPDGGFGHAYGFVMERLLPGLPIPAVPILLNTFYPPNQPSPQRCIRFGEGLRKAIAACELDIRVAVVASGGLSHFVVNEPLDRTVLDAICVGDVGSLVSIPTAELNAGSSEIRNWLTVAAMMSDRPISFCHYVPAVRSEAGTGVGIAFVAWDCEEE